MDKIINFKKGKEFKSVGDLNKNVRDGGAVIARNHSRTIYRVKSVEDGTLYSFVMFNAPMQTEFIENLKKIANKPSPSPLLLWPIEVITDFKGKEYNLGYLTQNIEENYQAFSFKNKIDFASKEAFLKAMSNFGWPMEALFAKGFCYGGFSYCVFANVETGDVLVGDVEYINMGDSRLLMDPTIGYCAPEISLGMFKADKYSDRFNLAFLMFYMLIGIHPYGDYTRGDDATKRMRYATNAVFVFDPNNDTNRLDPVDDSQALAIERWNILPEYIKELFIKAFTAGVPDSKKSKKTLEIERQQRTSVKEWRVNLLKWLDTLVACPDCQKGICADTSDPRNLVANCPYCGFNGRIYRPVLAIPNKNKRFGNRSIRYVVLDSHKHISLMFEKNINCAKNSAFVLHSSTKEGVYGLANLGSDFWKVNIPEGKSFTLGLNEAIPTIDGISVNFDYEMSGNVIYEYDYDAFAETKATDYISIPVDCDEDDSESDAEKTASIDMPVV